MLNSWAGKRATGNCAVDADGNATATIGGMPAPVSFAGLAPGFIGPYQVNVQAPQGVAAGDAVPVILSIGATASNIVTISVH